MPVRAAHRDDLRHLSPPALLVQPAAGRHRRHQVLARGRPRQLWRPGRPGRPAHQHEAHRPALGGSTRLARPDGERHRAVEHNLHGCCAEPAPCRRFDVRAEDVARLSPVWFDHINMLGRAAIPRSWRTRAELQFRFRCYRTSKLCWGHSMGSGPSLLRPASALVRPPPDGYSAARSAVRGRTVP